MEQKKITIQEYELKLLPQFVIATEKSIIIILQNSFYCSGSQTFPGICLLKVHSCQPINFKFIINSDLGGNT